MRAVPLRQVLESGHLVAGRHKALRFVVDLDKVPVRVGEAEGRSVANLMVDPFSLNALLT